MDIIVSFKRKMVEIFVGEKWRVYWTDAHLLFNNGISLSFFCSVSKCVLVHIYCMSPTCLFRRFNMNQKCWNSFIFWWQAKKKCYLRFSKYRLCLCVLTVKPSKNLHNIVKDMLSDCFTHSFIHSDHYLIKIERHQ